MIDSFYLYMSNIDKIHGVKREFENKLQQLDYNEYNSINLKSVQLRIKNINLEDESAKKVQRMMIDLINSLDNTSQPKSDEEWQMVKELIITKRGLIEPNTNPFNLSQQAATVVRIWNGLLGLQYHLEENYSIL